MSKIEVNYYESPPNTLLGSEKYEDIEETLLPHEVKSGKRIFTTKKFSSHPEYRWEVIDVKLQPTVPGHATVFDVTLSRHTQLDKADYLTQIIKGKTVASVLQKYAIVEVEFGHAPRIGKANGDIRSNKRYPDSIQSGNMPKRRLAIVLRVVSKGIRPVAQVVPISSVVPAVGEKSSIEITGSLRPFVHYNKRSWAICSMIETVPITRIIAPLIFRRYGIPNRDTAFKTKLESFDRAGFEIALMHGIGREQYIKDIDNNKSTITNLNDKIIALEKAICNLNLKLQHAEIHEQMARDYAGVFDENNFEDFREKYNSGN